MQILVIMSSFQINFNIKFENFIVSHILNIIAFIFIILSFNIYKFMLY